MVKQFQRSIFITSSRRVTPIWHSNFRIVLTDAIDVDTEAGFKANVGIKEETGVEGKDGIVETDLGVLGIKIGKEIGFKTPFDGASVDLEKAGNKVKKVRIKHGFASRNCYCTNNYFSHTSSRWGSFHLYHLSQRKKFLKLFLFSSLITDAFFNRSTFSHKQL